MTEEHGLGSFDLNEEIARFRPEDNASGRRAETLVKSDGLRVVLVTMRPGAALHEHTAPGPITIHALRGAFRVTVEEDEQALDPGFVVAVAAGVRHAVECRDEGAFLLTIGAAPSR